MAKQPRKPAQAKPITTHQLFPAVVALWFGALFGLGSLAVRPSLLESLVIQSRIDLLIPAAAPPLGVTARILLALVLAAIGSAIGIAIARRITRPKTEVRERKRNALATDPAEFQPRYRTAYADASTNPPPLITEAADADAGPDTGVLAQRRRALTIEHDERDFVPYETAPLPGGAPQILDISQVGMAGASEEVPLELGAMAAEAVEETAPQVFEAAPAAVAASDFAPSDDRQVFGVNPQPAMSDAAKQIFGQVVDGDHVSEDFIKAAGFQTSVFQTPDPSPLFAPREAAAQEPAPVATIPEEPVVPHYEMPAPVEPTVSVAEPVVETVTASQPITADLGMTDLAGRLAESMARRRAARSVKTEVAEQAQTALEPAVPVSEPAPVIEAAIPQAFEAPAAIASLPPVFEAPPFAAPIPQAFEPAPVEAAAPAAFEPEPLVVTPAIPQAMRPLDLDGFEEDDDHLSSLLPPRHIAMRAPVEPVAFEPAPQPAIEIEEPEIAEAEVAEANYASLLGVASNFAANPGFVRIDEPEAEVAAIEPVVIFPGQMVRQPDMAVAEESAGFRRFDAPGSAGQGAPIAANQSAPEVDVAESERALRMALANLQRMSGAA